MLRSVGGVLAGVLLGGLIIAAIEALNVALFPGARAGVPGEPIDLSLVAPHMLVGVLVAWAVGTAAGAWLAVRIARRQPTGHALIVGAVFLAGAIANMLAIPHPLWFWVVAVLLFFPAALLGAKLGAAWPARYQRAP